MNTQTSSRGTPQKLTPVIKDFIWGRETWFTGTQPYEHPVLIKLIETREPLSLQVHPDDGYARRAENTNAPDMPARGKNEMWYVLEAGASSELVLGFSEPADKKELARLIENGGIMTIVNKVPVKAGDCYLIPAGLVHAIGADIKILEVQQNSNITYRIYDYGRTDKQGNPRELHIKKALDVIDTSLAAKKADSEILSDWEFFRSELVKTDNGQYIKVISAEQPEYEYIAFTDGAVMLLKSAESAGGLSPCSRPLAKNY